MNGGGGGKGGVAAANCLRWGHFALIRKSIYDSAQKTPEQAQARLNVRPYLCYSFCHCVSVCVCVGVCWYLLRNYLIRKCLLPAHNTLYACFYCAATRWKGNPAHTHTHTYMGAALCACVWRRQRVVCLYILYLSLCLCVCVVEFVYFLLTFFTRVCVCWGLFARLDCRFKDSTANSSAAPAVRLSYSTLPVCVCVWVVCVTLPLGGNERSLVVNPT